MTDFYCPLSILNTVYSEHAELRSPDVSVSECVISHTCLTHIHSGRVPKKGGAISSLGAVSLVNMETEELPLTFSRLHCSLYNLNDFSFMPSLFLNRTCNYLVIFLLLYCLTRYKFQVLEALELSLNSVRDVK